MKRDLRLEAFHPHPPALASRALTERAALKEWLMENDFEPVVGHVRDDRLHPPQRLEGARPRRDPSGGRASGAQRRMSQVPQ
jgi:glutathione S-transferase